MALFLKPSPTSASEPIAELKPDDIALPGDILLAIIAEFDIVLVAIPQRQIEVLGQLVEQAWFNPIVALIIDV